MVIGQMVGMVPSASASGGVQFSEFATHPYASQTGYDPGKGSCPASSPTFCPVGQTLGDMAITSTGKIVAGYGEWNANIDSSGRAQGGVYVAPIDATTGLWDGQAFRVNSEAMDTVREIGGNVYIAQTDPSNIPPTGYAQVTAGIVTDKGGSWKLIPITMADGTSPTLEHMFDVASLDGGDKDLWLFASHCFEWWTGCYANEGVAARSKDGGATWSFAKTDNSAPGSQNGYERNYWGQVVDGKVYTQARGVVPATPMHIYDSKTDAWSDWGTGNDSVCNTWAGKYVVSFDHHLVCSSYGGAINVLDGSSVKSISYGVSGGSVADFYIGPDGYLYILDSNGSIYRTDSLDTPFGLVGRTTGVNGTSASILVYNDSIYIGSDGGKIYKSTTTIASMAPIVPEVSSISPKRIALDDKVKAVTVTGRDFTPQMTATVGGVEVPVTVSSDSQLSLAVDTKLLSKPSVGTSTQDYDVILTNATGQSVTVRAGIIGVASATSTPPPTTTTPSAPTQPGSTAPASNQSSTQPAGRRAPLRKIVLDRLARTGESLPTIALIGVTVIIFATVFVRLRRRSSSPSLHARR